MKHHLRIIGDVHGLKEKYLHLLRKTEYSIQLGDMGFDYDFLKSVDSERHKFFGGNHDNYNKIDVPHNLGNHGVYSIPNWGDIFFVRGAYSIDWAHRTLGVSWWFAEELNCREAQEALEAYGKAKPNFVITHGCPTSIVQYVTGSTWVERTQTGNLLQAMLDIHKPQVWVFGHFHKSWRQKIVETEFICLNELECLDFPERK